MNFEEMQVRTTKGTEIGSVYIVAFEGDGLKVSVRPFINHHPLLLSLAMRVRVEPMEEGGSVELAKELLNMPFHMKGKHCSVTLAVPIMSAPFGPKEANERVFSKGLIHMLLEEVTNKVLSYKKMKQVTAPEALFEVVANQVRDQLPTDTLCEVEAKVYYDDLSPVVDQIRSVIAAKVKKPDHDSKNND